MTRYIALLRGINVSGKNIIKMELLRKALASLPISAVSTYIQSGNILFTSDEKNPVVLEKAIGDLIAEVFGLEITVIVVTPEILGLAIEKNPFAAKTPTDSVQPYIVFLSDEPLAENHEALQAVDFQNDEFVIIGKVIYVWYADSAANTKLNNAIIERKLKIRTTARNLKTIKKLIELSAKD
ncbi:DUF1697 domain-containing protein [Flavobacterium silvaticum]|uniref:DUF1697 domain-containing protein n=1 Tax=Flavobacterium silvaticum TaxID=1852020 RepID=A0A972FMU9_9FLAO|nr:DUF1697 domain-containing protein [Flavobacterium silvaticum]NMH28959.1 DUF1697 domain-containing protein [Flavobacterium silvaticum]